MVQLLRVTVPVRGIRLHPTLQFRYFKATFCYCPREGYKVASAAEADIVPISRVTVPVRGIRLHPTADDLLANAKFVTVPVRGIRLHPFPNFCNGCGTCGLLSP